MTRGPFGNCLECGASPAEPCTCNAPAPLSLAEARLRGDVPEFGELVVIPCDCGGIDARPCSCGNTGLRTLIRVL